MPVHTREVLGDLPDAAHHGVDVSSDQGAQVVDREHVRRVRHADDRRVTPEADRQHAVAPRDRFRHELDGLRIELEVVEIDEFHADLGGHRPDEVFFADQAELGEDLAERTPGCGLLAQCGGDLFLGDLAGLDESVRECGCRGVLSLGFGWREVDRSVGGERCRRERRIFRVAADRGGRRRLVLLGGSLCLRLGGRSGRSGRSGRCPSGSFLANSIGGNYQVEDHL